MWYTRSSNPKMRVKRSSKVSPTGPHHPNRNHLFLKNTSSLQSIKIQIRTAFIFAANRLYLLKPNRFVLFLSYIYSITLPILVVIAIQDVDEISVTYSVFKYTCCIEYILIVLITLLASKKKLFNLFRDLDKFDELLNINKDLNVIDSGYTCCYWLSGCFLYSMIEYGCCFFYLSIFIDKAVNCLYVMMITHDCEQVMYFILLRNIYLRLRIIKAHVFKVFNVEYRTNNYRGKLYKVEALANNARLNISSLHRVYDLLHKCAFELNSIMSWPLLIIMLTAGLSTTMLLKMVVQVIQTVTVSSAFGKTTMVYLIGRGMKFTVLVIVPCYYSSVTSSQVSAIRTALHDAINSFPLDKIERRKVKAFFQLTRENEFTYALGGVIRLSMSLPLSYMSLCTTYLVISIQFSKFFY